MKICAHCTTENRDEAIFCRHCRHPLQASQTREESSTRTFHLWLLAMFLLIGLSYSFFSPNSFLNSSPALQTSSSDTMAADGPVATRTKEPFTPSACVRYNTNIRRGPGTHYETTGGLLPEACLTILGRNDTASWVYIISDDHQTGWVDVTLLNDTWGLDRVSIRDGDALANTDRATLTSEEIAYGAKAYSTRIAETNLPQAPVTQYFIPCFQTASRLGEHISCRMEKAVCDYLPALEGSPTFCNDRPYPDHNFALIVFGEDWSEYDGQCLIISGYLEIDKGVLKIEATRRDQVSYCD